MFEVGKKYKHIDNYSGPIYEVLYVGEKVTLVKFNDTDDGPIETTLMNKSFNKHIEYKEPKQKTFYVHLYKNGSAICYENIYKDSKVTAINKVVLTEEEFDV